LDSQVSTLENFSGDLKLESKGKINKKCFESFLCQQRDFLAKKHETFDCQVYEPVRDALSST
jgi:hypothetical protein